MPNLFTERNSVLTITRKRYFAGVAVHRDATQVSGVVLSMVGEGLDAQINLITQGHVELPCTLKDDLVSLQSEESLPTENAADLAAQISELQAVVVENMLHECGIEASQVTAIGVWGPEVWSSDQADGCSTLTLGSAQLLAETTGITVVDAFPERDVAASGSGGPIEALPLWLIFQQPQLSNTGKPLLLISLDQEIDAFFLPNRRVGMSPSKICWAPIAPGLRLLEACFHSSRNSNTDISTQNVVEHWHAVPELYDLPVWRPHGLSSSLFLEGVSLPKESDAVEKLTRQFWVKQIVHAWQAQLPQTPKVSEVLLFGPGADDAKLVEQLQRRFGDIPVDSVWSKEWDLGSPNAAVAATLAYLQVEKIPGSIPTLTGAKSARVLGRITPGSPANWQAFLRQLTEKKSARMPLRDAV